MIYIVEVSSVSKAIEEMLVADFALGQSGVRIERSGDPDTDDGSRGFVGIYRDRLTFPPRTLGVGSGYRRQNISFTLVMKESNPNSGEECEEALELLVKNVMRCILSDESLKGTVDTLDENIEVRYDRYDQIDGLYVQNAILFFTAIVNVVRRV